MVEVFRRFFEAIVEQCQQAQLVWGKELYIDSTQVHANADLDSLVPRFAVDAREATQEHLAALFAPEAAPPGHTKEQSVKVLLPQQAPGNPKPFPLPTTISQARRAELAEENAARHDWIKEEGRQQREVYGSYWRTADFWVSTTDPDATPMHLKGGRHPPGVPYPFCCRWRQTPDHSGSPHRSRGSHGQSASAWLALAGALSLAYSAEAR
jgi:hypothetical protein